MSKAAAASSSVTARPLAEIIADLSQPIAPDDLGTIEVTNKKTGKTSELTYIPWHRAIGYLDRLAPGWSYEVRNIFHLEGRVAMVVRISIPAAEGLIFREATGQEQDQTNSFGDPTSNAESMALRRAAAKFGLGLYLYRGGSGASAAAARDPHPKTLGDLVTPKQLWMIRNMGREFGCDVEYECDQMFKVPLEEISKKAASALIDELKKYGESCAEEIKEVAPEPKPAKAAPRPKGVAGQILAFASDVLKWDEPKLADKIYKHLNLAIDDAGLQSTLESLSAADQQKLFQAIKEEQNK